MDLETLVIGGIVGLFTGLVFLILMGLRMAKQLEPDAHLKGVKTVLIEGEVLDVIVGDVLEYIPDRIT